MSTQHVLLAVGLAANCVALFVIGAVTFVRREEGPSPFDRVRAALRYRPTNPAQSLQNIKAQASEIAERSLDRSGRRGGVETALEQAGLNMRAGEFLVVSVTASVAAFVVGIALSGLLLGMLLGGAVLGSAHGFLRMLVGRRRAKFAAQLEQTLPLMAGSLRAGFGLMQSLDAVARGSDSPTSEEFGRLVMESRLGRDLGESLHALSERVECEDFAFVVQAIEIHREVGGDLAEVLDKVASTIRDRNRIRRQIKTLTAEGRISAGILLALPVVMFFVIQAINPGYLHELTGNTLGRMLLLAGVVLIGVGALWMRRLIRLVF
jgi:tight adherence protein B